MFAPYLDAKTRRKQDACCVARSHSELYTLNTGSLQASSDMAHSQAIGHEALRQYADYNLNHLGTYFPSVAGKPAVIPEATNFKDFVLELKRVLERQALPERAFDWIFSPHQILNKPRPNCGGMH